MEPTTPAPPAEPPADPPADKDSAARVMAEIASRLDSSLADVRQGLVDALVQKELDERVKLLVSAVGRRNEQLSELRKVDRPDVVTYDDAGQVASGTYTKERLKDIKDRKEKLAKLETAIARALSNDFSKLKDQGK